MNIRAELDQLSRDLLSDDAQLALSACRRLADDHLPWLRDRAALRARTEGWSWRAIGQLLGITAQAAHQRYGTLTHAPPSTPSPKQEWNGASDGPYWDYVRAARLRRELSDWEASGTDIVPW